TGLKADTDLAQLLLDRIPVAFPMAKGSPLPQQLKGTVEVSVAKITAGPQGVSGLEADVTIKNGYIAMKELASAVKDLNETVKITPAEVIINRSTFSLGEGSITAQGTIKDYLAQQVFDMKVDVEKLRLQDVVPATAPVKAEGLVSGTITASGRGFTPEALKETLSGLATMGLTQGKLRDMNVLRSVLDQINIIPGLSQQLEQGLPQRWKEKLSMKDTALSDIKLPITVENGRLLIKDTVIGADEFIFKGAGEAGLSGAFSIQGDFLIPQDLSQAMIAQVKQLEYLVNDSGQILIPLKVTGTAGAKPVFFVDPEYIAKRILVEQGARQIFKLLDKALGGGETQQPTEGQAAQPSQNATQQQEGSTQPTTEEAVKDIFRGIFGK
ncbi:MAG: AsmA-like C-terminal region-containing protein, partial [Candidatus Omnitrophica bacterium]|nr:AsmA-like C-terminal region-containing protein [Candidatus Omnitrophota bacterium]